MEHFLGVAREKGIRSEELEIVKNIVMAVSGGKIRAQFQEVKDRINNNKS